MTLVGVSIPVPEPWGDFLRAKRRSYGDIGAETIPSHITLVPPLEFGRAELESFQNALARVAVKTQAFDVELRGTDTFRPVSEVVFVALVNGIVETTALAQSIRTAGSVPEPEFAFHPHVTVAQNVVSDVLDQAASELAEFSCRFTVEGFCLHEFVAPEGWVARELFAFG